MKRDFSGDCRHLSPHGRAVRCPRRQKQSLRLFSSATLVAPSLFESLFSKKTKHHRSGEGEERGIQRAEDFSPCCLRASSTHSTAQMRTPFRSAMLAEGCFQPLSLCKKQNTTHSGDVLFLAQEEGFEPPWLLAKRFSRPPRYDRFDIPAYNDVHSCIIMRRKPIFALLMM